MEMSTQEKMQVMHAKFTKACSQLKILNNQVQALNVRFRRATKGRRNASRYNLRIRLCVAEGVRNMIYEYALSLAEELDKLQIEVSRQSHTDLHVVAREERNWKIYMQFWFAQKGPPEDHPIIQVKVHLNMPKMNILNVFKNIWTMQFIYTYMYMCTCVKVKTFVTKTNFKTNGRHANKQFFYYAPCEIWINIFFK